MAQSKSGYTRPPSKFAWKVVCMVGKDDRAWLGIYADDSGDYASTRVIDLRAKLGPDLTSSEIFDRTFAWMIKERDRIMEAYGGDRTDEPLL